MQEQKETVYSEESHDVQPFRVTPPRSLRTFPMEQNAPRRPTRSAASRRGKRWLALFLPLLALLPLPANAGQFGEYEIKAGFLYNFMNFVNWSEAPEGAGNQMVVVVFDTGATGQTIAAVLAAESVQGRAIRVIQTTQPADARKAHLLFVPAAYGGDPVKILQAIHGRPVLTVGESPSFIAAGGMINFVRQGTKIRFEINPRAAQEAGLRISSQLLRLAIIADGPHSQERPRDSPESARLAETRAPESPRAER